jgi:hypothetical protein
MGALHVVQLEFDGLGAEERFDRLRAALPPVPVHRVDPVFLNIAADVFTAIAPRADRLADRLGALPARAAVVIQAYCTGTSLALAAAARLERDGHEVRLVQLFNPEAVTPAHIETAYWELADRLGAPPGQPQQLARSVLGEGGPDGAEGKLRALRSGLCEAGQQFARRLGVPEPDAATFSLELVDRYCAWLNFLLSSLEAQPEAEAPVRVYLGGLTDPGLLASAAADVRLTRGDGHAADLPAGRGGRLAVAD